MHSQRFLAGTLSALALMFSFAGAASALTVTCAGTPALGNVAWTSSVSGGVSPTALLWGNGATTSSQTISYAPGLQSITLQATDASSTVATTTCSATVPQALPTINSFIVSPTSITSGQSATLSWSVSNASSTSIDNGVGTVSSSSITITPGTTTTYHLTATNPSGSTSAAATIIVSPVGTGISAQIQALLAQIAALKAQIVALIQTQGNNGSGNGSGTGTTTPPLPGNKCGFWNRNMRFGHRGDDVTELQKMLASDPSIFSGVPTGFFGKDTEKALRKFQRKFGIITSNDASSTILFGPLTRVFLNNRCEKDSGHSGNDHDNGRKDHDD